jgi:hypothetical protein
MAHHRAHRRRLALIDHPLIMTNAWRPKPPSSYLGGMPFLIRVVLPSLSMLAVALLPLALLLVPARASENGSVRIGLGPQHSIAAHRSINDAVGNDPVRPAPECDEQHAAQDGRER